MLALLRSKQRCANIGIGRRPADRGTHLAHKAWTSLMRSRGRCTVDDVKLDEGE